MYGPYHSLTNIMAPLMIAQAATQLFSAVRDGDIATVKKLLIEKHVDVNVTDKVRTPCFCI